MSTQRAVGQKLISVPMKEKFIESIDQALEKIGYSDRSSFIRDAIAEKLRAAGVILPIELRLAPSRTGKGGRPRHVQPAEPEVSASAAKRKQHDGKAKIRLPDKVSGPMFGRNYSAK